MDQLVWHFKGVKPRPQTFFMRVGKKHLAMIVYADFLQEIINPGLIKLFKNIVQEKERSKAIEVSQHLKFCELKRKQHALPLPLRGNRFEGLRF